MVQTDMSRRNIIVPTKAIIIVKDCIIMWKRLSSIQLDIMVSNPSSILGLDTMLRNASEARVDRRLRRYYLIVLLLPTVFTLACLPLSSI